MFSIPAMLLMLFSPPVAHATGLPTVPCLQGPFERVFVPAHGRYINDHTLVRDRHGVWHLFAIAHDSKGDAYQEKSFLHATAPSLFGPWTEHEDVLHADSDRLNELVLWAPHVVQWRHGHWAMFYWGEWVRPEEPGYRGIRRADSRDLFHWQKLETVSDPAIRPPGGRDPFLMEFQGRWLLYSVGVDNFHGQIVLSESPSLVPGKTQWTNTIPVTTDPVPNFGWGNLESPFVQKHGDWFYLFTTRTGPNEPAEYLREVVLRSRDPKHFDWDPVTEFEAHASEIVTERGIDYVTSAGWTSVIGEENRGLKIAPLGWCLRR